MVRNIENGLALIEKWLRNKNTIEFLGIWEEMYNPDFNFPEFEGIKNEAGLNRFILSVKQWTEKTNSRRLIAKAGRYGGTYAHKDIAFEFASWDSPQFKLKSPVGGNGREPRLSPLPAAKVLLLFYKSMTDPQ